MTTSSSAITGVFARNRAEELGYDLWEEFVIPPFYDRLDLQIATKPRIIIAGRGCGKTMLLRYLSHETMFSRRRVRTNAVDLEHIGLYWRVDTHFGSAMQARGVESGTWRAAFDHMAALSMGMELLRSLRSIANCPACPVSESDIDTADFSSLSAFDTDLPSQRKALQEVLERKQWALQAWVNNVRSKSPHFLPGKAFIEAMISLIQRTVPGLNNAGYRVYLDEYENLLDSQKESVNTWLKHSNNLLMFHVAVKRNAFDHPQTSGPEMLSNVHDYREHDLESYLREGNEFRVFAAEILFHKLAKIGETDLPVDIDLLRRPEGLVIRREAEYRKNVIEAAQNHFPGMTHRELAEYVFNDPSLLRTLRSRLRTALERYESAISEDSFIRPTLSQASIIVPALLHRRSISPEDVLRELDLLQDEKENRFTGRTGWIHNNFIGCLLQLFDPGSRTCPFYAGFDAFCSMSDGNLRHFLELCHKSVYRAAGHDSSPKVAVVSPADQAIAARDASATFLSEVRTFGPHGNQLHAFVLRLGTLFQLAHRRPAQSETEQSHFAIVGGRAQLNSQQYALLSEAVKWSVLFEVEGTKKRDAEIAEHTDFILNPIYAPYFYISYRKKRKLEITTDDMVVLVNGNAREVNNLLARYSKKWHVESDGSEPTLFASLDS